MNGFHLSKQLQTALLWVFFMLLCLFYGILFINTCMSHDFRWMLGSDAWGYYDYLVGLFIKKDIAHINYAIPLPNGNTLDGYQYGVALLEAPFFLVSWLISIFVYDTVTGYEKIFSFSVMIAGAFYAFWGLVLVFRILEKFFLKKTAYLTTIILFLATNLMYFTTVTPGYSHVFSFFAIALTVHRTILYYEKSTLKNAILLGIGIGLVTIIRLLNVVIILYVFLYQIYTWTELKDRVRFYIIKYKHILIFIFIVFLFFIPQMLYWHLVTGHYLTYSYGYGADKGTFPYLTNPKIFYPFINYYSGWLNFNPVFVLFFIGLGFLFAKRKHSPFAITLVFLIVVYTYAAWWFYQMWGMGYRAYIDFYAIIVIPMAFMVEKIVCLERKWLKITLVILLAVLIVSNLRFPFHFFTWMFDSPDYGWGYFFKIVLKTLFIK